MKHISPVLMLSLLLVWCFYSCQKNLSDPSVTGADSTAAFLPKQMIITAYNAGPPVTSTRQYYAIKYAANKQQIDVYLDDTTNANPYDVLSSSFAFNNNGYIVSYTSQAYGSREESEFITVGRGSDNKITSIISLYKRYGKPFVIDTSILHYTTTGAGTQIAVFLKRIDFDDLSQLPKTQYDTSTYVYDKTNKLMQLRKYNYGIYDCSYNPNGSFKSIHYADAGMNVSDAAFSYTSGLNDSGEDFMQKLLSGEDYYLQDIEDFPAFGDRYDEPNCCIFSLTNRYHISNIHVVTTRYGQTDTNDYNYVYQIDANKMPVSILTNRFQKVLTEFRY